ncbi:hypothetical protein AB0K09_17425 [Streptomyces sp. NPDC049577]|uniref:hypothetical protein n=1 Tax=Streptomyces sp. NPDC049577 TaxID=3155153 RepID=UPI00344164F3
MTTSTRMTGRFRGTVLTIASALTLLVALPTSAQGATGSYTYVTQAGQAISGRDPQSDICLQIPGGAVRFSNDTTDTAFLYADSSCGGGWALVGVGATWDWQGVPALGVRFGSTTVAAPAGGTHP